MSNLNKNFCAALDQLMIDRHTGVEAMQRAKAEIDKELALIDELKGAYRRVENARRDLLERLSGARPVFPREPHATPPSFSANHTSKRHQRTKGAYGPYAGGAMQ